MDEAFSIVLKVCAWISLLALFLVTLGPIDDRPISGAPVYYEHFGAFACVACIFAFAYPKRILLVAAFLVVTAIPLELLQTLVPGRHGRLSDVSIKIVGALFGVVIGSLASRWRHLFMRAPPY